MGIQPLQSDTGSFSVVNRVVDSLDVRIYEPRLPSSWLLERLDVWREHIATWEFGSPDLHVELPGLGTFRVQSDRRPYEIVLINSQLCDIRIWNPDKWLSSWPDTGQFYVSFRSRFMQFAGILEAQRVLEDITDLLCTLKLETSTGVKILPAGYQRVSRADLAADLQIDRDMRWSDLHGFVCRSRSLDVWTTPYPGSPRDALKAVLADQNTAPPPMGNKGGCNPALDLPSQLPDLFPLADAAHILLSQFAAHQLEQTQTRGSSTVSRCVGTTNAPQTVYFGKFGSKLYARRYNKLLSLPVQQKLYMLDVWAANGWNQLNPVWRTEFSLSGDFLREVALPGGVWDVRELSAFMGALANIWLYLTSSWLREVQPEENTRLENCPTSLPWLTVQTAWTAPDGPSLRVTPEPRPNIDQLEAQAKGVALSWAALEISHLTRMARAGDDVTCADAAALVSAKIFDYISADPEWLELRRKDLSHGTLTDTYLSGVYRRQRMDFGSGS